MMTIDEVVELLSELAEGGGHTEAEIEAVTLACALLQGLPKPVSYDRKLGIDVRGQDKSYWLTKIREEVAEFAAEPPHGAKEVEELQDIITVCTSCLAYYDGLGKSGRAAIGRLVNEKNGKRGGFNDF